MTMRRCATAWAYLLIFYCGVGVICAETPVEVDEGKARNEYLEKLKKIKARELSYEETRTTLTKLRKSSLAKDQAWVPILKEIVLEYPDGHRDIVMDALYHLYLLKISRDYFWDNIRHYKEIKNDFVAAYSILVLVYEMDRKELEQLKNIIHEIGDKKVPSPIDAAVKVT